jgi:hypothetical protein
MFKTRPSAGQRLMPLAISFCTLACAVPALAQTASDQEAKKSDAKRPTVSQAKPSSPNATVNLVNLLVKQGILKEDQAAALIKQAEDEAYVSRQAAKDANAKADEAAKAATAASAAASPPGTKHVTYVPEIVKRQLREELKKEVMASAQKDGWASPGAYPEWAHRIRFYGDMRLRYQGDFFPAGNDQQDAFNFNAINTGSPFDINPSNPANLPTYNTSQDRQQVKLRARLGMEADIYGGLSAGIRIATGENSTPVSTNQSLGLSTSGSNFSKYALWLDRGYMKYQGWGDEFTFSAGRFDNPFWSPTDLVWYKDLGFDGFAVQAKHEVYKGITPFIVAGAFPIYNTDLNVGSNSGILDSNTGVAGTAVKLASHDKWLFGGQAGFEARFQPESAFRFAVAYYDFDNVQGLVSAPCSVTSTADVCSTDLTRPAFAQKGNTYMALRQFDAATLASQANFFEFFGLVGKYRPVVANAQLDFGDFHPVHVVLDGEYVWNSAFNRNLMLNPPGFPGFIFNNFGASAPFTRGSFVGGNQGYLTRITVGEKEIQHLWDWNVHAGYRYLESDATLDAFTDPDFGLGGTNLKGYFVGANLGLGDNVWATARWMSANNIAGIPFAVDVLQVDLNARF